MKKRHFTIANGLHYRYYCGLTLLQVYEYSTRALESRYDGGCPGVGRLFLRREIVSDNVSVGNKRESLGAKHRWGLHFQAKSLGHVTGSIREEANASVGTSRCASPGLSAKA
jgi:hypothetical protein